MKLNVKLVAVASVVIILFLVAMWWKLHDRRLEAGIQTVLSPAHPRLQSPDVPTIHATPEPIWATPRQETINSDPLIDPTSSLHAGSDGASNTSTAESSATPFFPKEGEVVDSRDQAVQMAAMRLRELAERKASPEELVQGLRELKRAAGSSGLPGIDLDSAIQSMNLAAVTLKQSEQMRQLIEKYEHTKDPAIKEEILKISQELTKLQKLDGDRSPKTSR